MKKIILLFLVFFGFMGMTIAQKTIEGMVSDEDGMPLIGANVLVPNTTVGTITDIDGTFTLEVPEETTELNISYTGFGDETVSIVGANDVNVVLSSGQILDEVVVSAIGIKKKKEDDLSSSSLIRTEALERSGETGVVQSLAGKTSGLNIVRNSGDPGAGAYIQIRGQNTVLGSSSPLIVLDGVPVSNSSIGGGTDGVVQQSRLNDIPAEDIESVTVLKGASAAAIYGSGAANGVIVITTKTGKSGGEKLSVNISTSIGVDEVNVEHEKQGIFGQGYPIGWASGDTIYTANEFGVFQQNSPFSWGDKISDRSGEDVVDEAGGRFVGDITGKTYYSIVEKGDRTVYNDSNRDQVFKNGLTQNFNAGISIAGSNNSTFISLGRVDQSGIFEGSDYKRNTIRINHTRQFTDRFSVRVNTSYANINSNRIQQGSNLNGLYLGYLRTAPDFNNTDYRGQYYSSPTSGSSLGHRAYRRALGDAAPVYNNPGWTLNEQKNPNEVNRFIISPQLDYKIASNVNLTVRYGVDIVSDKRETFFPYLSAAGNSGGYFSNTNLFETTQQFNTFLNGNNNLTDNIGLNWVIGYSIDDYQYDETFQSAANFLNVDASKQLLQNALSENIDADRYEENTRKNGAFYSLGFDIGSLLFETTGRYERTSTLSDEAFFFPSISAGWKFTDYLSEDGILSFGKLRASYGEIGIEPLAYLNRDVVETGTAGSVGWGDELNGPLYGGAFRYDDTKGNPDLTIERVKEWEVGTDLKFFKNKLNLGLTYYNRLTVDALLNVEVPASTGFTEQYLNTAEISNKGFELDLEYRQYVNEDMSWSIYSNFSTNKNLVEKLPNVSRVFLAGFTGTQSVAIEGEPFASIYGGKWERDDQGGYVLDELGFPTVAVDQGVIGDPNPDWKGGLGASLNYKGLTGSFLIETSQGQDMWGGTQGVLKFFGVHTETANISVAPEDIYNYAGQLIPAGSEFRGNIEDFGAGPVALDAEWYTTNGGGFGDVSEDFVSDASWTRLREVSIGYKLPANILGDTGLDNIEIALTGRNLFLWTDFVGVDPDTNLTGATKGRGLDYFTNPGTRSYLATIKLGF